MVYGCRKKSWRDVVERIESAVGLGQCSAVLRATLGAASRRELNYDPEL